MDWRVGVVEHHAREAKIRRAVTLANRVAIASLLVLCTGVAWIMMSPMRHRYPARETAAAQVTSIQQAIEVHRVQNRNACPQSLDELARAGIVLRVPADPWGEPYAFRCSPTEAPYVWSAGPDRTFGTEDDIDTVP